MFKSILIITCVMIFIAAIDSPEPDIKELVPKQQTGLPASNYPMLGDEIIVRETRDIYFDNNYDAILGHHDYSNK